MSLRGNPVRGRVTYFEPHAQLVVQFTQGFSVALKDAVKAIPGTRWDASTKSWLVPSVSAQRLVRALAGHIFALDDAARRIMDASLSSSGQDATVEHPVLAPANVPSPVVEAAKQTTLPYAAPVLRAERALIAPQERYQSVSQVHARAQRVLQREFAARECVVGVATGVKIASNGAIYLTLHDQDAAQSATLSVTIFPNAAPSILAELKDASLTLEEGLLVALHGRLSLYALRSSVQWIADGIDVRVSRGELELQRDRVVRALREAGLSKMNAALPVPLLPMNVAVVTSAQGEAWHDLLRTLTKAEVGVSLTLYDVNVQGAKLEATVLRAIRALEQKPYDLVVVIRGGGAANELAGWDNFRVAEAIARCTIPVVVGIGHQRDESALHEVARYEATPTAVGEWIVAHWQEARRRTEVQEELLTRLATQRLEREGRVQTLRAESFRNRALRRIDADRTRVERELPRTLQMAWTSRRARASLQERTLTESLIRGAERVMAQQESAQQRWVSRFNDGRLRHELTAHEGRWERASASLATVAQRALAQRESALNLAQSELKAVDPRRWLARGYVMARRPDGTLATSVQGLRPGDALVLDFADGQVHAAVVDVENTTNSSSARTSRRED